LRNLFLSTVQVRLRQFLLIASCLIFFVTAGSAEQQTATVVVNAPIYVSAAVTQTPLRVAAVGTRLLVAQQQGDWVQVEFRDPQFGRRIGWVQAANLQLVKPDTAPMDLSVAASPAPAAVPAAADSSSGPVAAAAAAPPSTAASPPTAAVAGSRSTTLFVTPTGDQFDVYISAALVKKGVPAAITTDSAAATYVLKASAVEIQQQSTGSKFARCIFASCAGIEDRGTTSVQLLSGTTVVWSYSVNKGRGQKNRQALAEAIAKHLKNEFFKLQ